MKNLNLKNKSVLVTGGNGFLGTFVVEELKRIGVTNISYPSSKELDLRINEN